jgi:peroxiredoxin/YHS domain-containing protein
MEGRTMNRKRISNSIALLALLAYSSACAAQSFTDFSLKGLDGKEVSTATLRENKVLAVKLGATWCGYCRQETQELVKLRKDFDPSDLAIVEVYIEEDAKTVAPHVKDLPLTILLDENGKVAAEYNVVGIPVMMVVDPTGKIAYRGNFTPHATLREGVRTALAARPAKPSPKTTAGKAQTACPVMGGAINKSVYTDYQGQRIYFCCPGCIATFQKDPEKYLKKMAEEGVTPEKIVAVCPQCGQIKGSADCCKPGQALCPKCGLAKGSPGCCKITKGTTETAQLCQACGNIQGSEECGANCAKPKASCAACQRVKGSPGCCKSDDELAQAGLCPKCGLEKGSPGCCQLQGKELCSMCGLVKGSPGCCKI